LRFRAANNNRRRRKRQHPLQHDARTTAHAN
jgi:hypothetical protein